MEGARESWSSSPSPAFDEFDLGGTGTGSDVPFEPPLSAISLSLSLSLRLRLQMKEMKEREARGATGKGGEGRKQKRERTISSKTLCFFFFFFFSLFHFFSPSTLLVSIPSIRWAFSPSSPAGSSGRAAARRPLLPRGRSPSRSRTTSTLCRPPPSTPRRSRPGSPVSLPREQGKPTPKLKEPLLFAAPPSSSNNSPLFVLPFRQQQQQQQRAPLRALISSSLKGESPSPSCRTRLE